MTHSQSVAPTVAIRTPSTCVQLVSNLKEASSRRFPLDCIRRWLFVSSPLSQASLLTLTKVERGPSRCLRSQGLRTPRCCDRQTRPTIPSFTSLHNIIEAFVVAANFVPSMILFALRKVHAPSFLTSGPRMMNCVFSIKYEYRWRKEWAPQLVETRYIFPPHASLDMRSNSSRTANGSFISTPLSWLVGKPPTAEAGFLSTAPRAGSCIKLIRGRNYNPVVLHSKVVEMRANASAGINITPTPAMSALTSSPSDFL